MAALHVKVVLVINIIPFLNNLLFIVVFFFL